MRPRIKASAKKLNAMTFKAQDKGYIIPKTFNMVCDYGQRTGRHSILGSANDFTSNSKYAFGTWAIAGLPFLEYSEKGALLRPEDCEEFLVWVDALESYPAELLQQYAPDDKESSKD
jgi:hypothetical protein